MELRDIKNLSDNDLRRYARNFQQSDELEIILAVPSKLASLDAIGRARAGHYQVAKAASQELRRREQAAASGAKEPKA